MSQVIDSEPVGNILKYRSWERIRLLKHHSHPASEQDDIHSRGINVLTIEVDTPLNPRAWNDIIHPVQRAEERGLAAAGRAYECRYQVGCNVKRDGLESARLPIIEVQILYAHLDGTFIRFTRWMADQEALFCGYSC